MKNNNKTVLVTGADGFIGSHLVEMLVSKGYKVRALAQYNSFNNWGWLEDVSCKGEFELITGDIRDPYFCKFISKKVDIIYHLAALIAIPYSYIAPDSYLETNIKGALNICQAARENNVEFLVHTSTSEVYGSAKYVPIDEDHPIQPQSPYSASKIAADAMAMSFYNAFDLPVAIARPFNTYGPRQSARAVIPTIITQIASGKNEINLGDVSPTRNFNYVKDTCRGLIDIGECKDAIGQTLNIGSSEEISIGKTFNLIKEIMGSDANLVEDITRLRPKNSEVIRLSCDSSKIEQFTGFKSQVSIEEGLQKTISWMIQEHNLNQYKTEIYNI